MVTVKGLTAAQIRTETQPGRYHDGGGLYFTIADGGSKSWVQRVTLDGTRAMRGLGGFPKVSLSEARKIAERNRAELKAGKNPFDKATKPAWLDTIAENITPTFTAAALVWYDNTFAKHPASAGKLWRHLEIDVLPAFDGRMVDEITRPEVAAIINRLRKEGKEPTSRKVRGAMREVFKWAVAAGHRLDNPADDNTDPLLWVSDHVEQHHKALHHDDVADALHRIHYGRGDMVCRLAMQFLVFTGARQGEVRGATWQEISEDGKTWNIPASRMKGRRAHDVPLSIQAQTVLNMARGLRGGPADSEIGFGPTIGPEDVIFVNPANSKALGPNSLVKRCHQDKLNCTPHGFRTSLTGWAMEQEYNPMLIELTLAHVIGSRTAQAYFRNNLLEERRGMMQAWGDYLDPAPF